MTPTPGDGQHAAPPRPLLACVVLAHNDPVHVRRLVLALDPFPVFLHCDVSTPPDVFEEMTRDLPDRCVLLDRVSTGWAKWENVAAEIEGYRAALAGTDATHIAVLTGSDYPITSAAVVLDLLAAHQGTSLVFYNRLPYDQWGRSGGLDRLRYRHWAFRKHMIRLPIPRKLPAGIVFAGGSQLKVLARRHAAVVVRAADEHPELVRFFRQSWIADETFVGSILSTPAFVADWSAEHVFTSLWWIGWDGVRRKSPPWLGIADLAELRENAVDEQAGVPRLFARKFSTAYDTAILDAIDRQNRGVAVDI